jgi:uncharacterized protein YjbJ (UPF0337 family)
MTDENIDKAKGRVKEALGALSADNGPRFEGRVEQAKGSTKHAVDMVADTLTAARQTTSWHRHARPHSTLNS